MKCLKKAIYLLLILLTFSTSYPQAMLIPGEEVRESAKVDVVDKVYKEKSDYLKINVTIPQIKNLKDAESEKVINDKIVKWTEDWIKDVKGVADEYFKGGPPPYTPYELYATYIVTNRDKVTSFYIDYYQFTGGAHGITTRVAYSVDNETGKELKLSDLFKMGYNYKDIINKEISRQIALDSDRYFSGKDGFNGIADNQKFYLENKKVIIYFGVYEIAPYVTGIPEFIIDSMLFNGNYKYK